MGPTPMPANSTLSTVILSGPMGLNLGILDLR